MSTRPDEPAHAPDSPRRPDPRAADDDPTHALDDFLRRLHASPGSRGRPDEGDPTDLSGLSARLHPGQPHQPDGSASRPAGAPPGKPGKGGTLRNGERWQADDVTDVPVVELPRVPPGPAATDDPQWHDIGRQASASAAQHAATAAGAVAGGHATAADDWQPDPAALQLRRPADPRLLPHWQPGAWIGAQRLVLQASTEFVRPPTAGALGPLSAPVVESHDAQCLLVLWAPPDTAQAPAGTAAEPVPPPCPSRWPRLVLLAPMSAQALAGHSAAVAADAMLAARPADASAAPLWLNPEPSHVDWALAAEIALHHLPELRPFQIDGLRAFIAAEREASFARVNDAYETVPGGALQKAG